MDSNRRPVPRTTSDALYSGTSVRYSHRSGDSLATVVERTDRYVTFVGPDCDGRFTHEQIDRLFDDDRLAVVLDDECHRPESPHRDPALE